MTTITVEAKKVGGSLMVRIPKDVVDAENIKEGELVKVEFHTLKKDWFGAFPGLSSFKKKDRFGSKYE
jgi:hypothetical protein